MDKHFIIKTLGKKKYLSNLSLTNRGKKLRYCEYIGLKKLDENILTKLLFLINLINFLIHLKNDAKYYRDVF